MGRRKLSKPRRPRRDWTDLERAADAYRCGHCHSATSWAKSKGDAVGRLIIQHDGTCPVLAGSVSDLPDAVRAADATGGMVVLDAATGQHVTVYGDDDQKAAFVAALTARGDRFFPPRLGDISGPQGGPEKGVQP